MGKGCFPPSGKKARLLRRGLSASLLVGLIGLGGCAGYSALNGHVDQRAAQTGALDPAAAPADPQRELAVAEIRAKAQTASANDEGTFPNVFHSYGPSGTSAMSRADRLAVEAELDAVLAAQMLASDPAEAKRLAARAAYLKKLASQHGAQAEADIQAASELAQ